MHRDLIDAELAARLVAGQFPQWADLPVTGVELDGWDNRTFRLGEHMSVRLPSAERYVAAVAKEARWLPRLAPCLPLPVPVPLATGRPTPDYPWPWSVRAWLPGRPAALAPAVDAVAFARDLAAFLLALHRVDARGGPGPGPANFHRGGRLEVYDEQTRAAAARLPPGVDAGLVDDVWAAALSSTWTGPPVWFHGDVATGNLLVRDGRLAAVIDFGTCGVGDPACDLVIAWTHLRGAARTAFVSAMALDDATWARARGWALWKALITLAGAEGSTAAAAATLTAVLADHPRHPGPG